MNTFFLKSPSGHITSFKKSQGDYCCRVYSKGIWAPYSLGSMVVSNSEQLHQLRFSDQQTSSFKKGKARLDDPNLHHPLYVDMYYTTRIPMLLVYKVCVRSSRISIMSRMTPTPDCVVAI